MIGSVGTGRYARLLSLMLLSCFASASAVWADGTTLAGSYERADLMQAHDHYRVFRNLRPYPRWISGDRFWYVRESVAGNQWMLVDAARGSSAPAFDHERLAAALRSAMTEAGKAEPKSDAATPSKPLEIKASDLPLRGMDLSDAPRTARFTAFGKRWIYDMRSNRLSKDVGQTDDPSWRRSPDGQWALFSRDHNLWVRNLHTEQEKPLTHDGEAFYAYGANPDATGRPAVKPEAVWSPDSKRVLAVQTDDRQVKDLPMINYAPEGSVRPVAFQRRTALPGDEHVTRFRMLAIDVESGEQVSADHRDVPAVRMNDTPVGGKRAWWGADSKIAYFVDVDRGERTARVIEFDTVTGRTRTVFSESSETYLELGSNVYAPASIVPLPESNEVIWYSERSGWAHLYLYDLVTGQLKRSITQGEWRVRDVLAVDPKARQIYISVAGRDSNKDPYYREIARAGLDGGGLEVLSSSDADHFVASSDTFELLLLAMRGEDIDAVSGFSPDRKYFVETVSRIDELPTTVVRDGRGNRIMVVEQATGPGLPQHWTPPEPTRLTAADGKTSISGVVFRPADFSSERKYPVIDYIYGGPQTSNVPESPGDNAFGAAQSLAELGFVVVIIDGRGTAERSRAFHEASYGAAETASNLEDHIAGIRQLAERYPYMDIERVGITGFSGGGYMAASAILRYPKFFKVAVAGSGNHDQRMFWHSWGERYQGLLKGDNYLQQANLSHVQNLEGRLLFIHGLMDFGVHPAGLFQLTQALMDANKKFDLVLMPRAGHAIPGYAMVRMWDYFVENLSGREPPFDFRAKSSGDYFAEEMKALQAEKAAAGTDAKR